MLDFSKYNNLLKKFNNRVRYISKVKPEQYDVNDSKLFNIAQEIDRERVILHYKQNGLEISLTNLEDYAFFYEMDSEELIEECNDIAKYNSVISQIYNARKRGTLFRFNI